MPTKSPFRTTPTGLEATNPDGTKVVIPTALKVKEFRAVMRSMSTVSDDDMDALMEALPERVAEAIDELDARLLMQAISAWTRALTEGMGEAPAS